MTAKRARPIKLPHAWVPRPWQARVLKAYKAGKRRFCIVVHRRAGKDQIGLNLAAIAAQMRVGLYQHIFPTERSNRNAIWKGMDKSDGRRFIDQAFPQALRCATREHTMEIEFTNGSLWKCLGSDNYNALRGGNPLGVVFSEYAFADPMSWTSIVAPILRENGGWAMFISTPNGKNHFYDLYQVAQANPDIWHVEYLTIADTTDAQGNPLVSAADVEQAKIEDGLSDADIRREFYCDWNAVYTGSYYGREMADMLREGRVAQVDHDPQRPVIAAWDIGFSDELVCLFLQKNGNAHRCIGSRSWQFTKYADALDDIELTFPWKVDKHVLPHDANKGSVQTGLTDAQQFEQLAGEAEVEIIDMLKVQTGIQAVRQMLPTLWVDNAVRPWAPEGNNRVLIDALGGYRTSKTRNGVFSRTPVHSWESHWADALRYYALGHELTSVSWGAPPRYDEIDRTVI